MVECGNHMYSSLLEEIFRPRPVVALREDGAKGLRRITHIHAEVWPRRSPVRQLESCQTT